MTERPNVSLANIFVHTDLRCRKYSPSDNTKVVDIVNHAFSYQDEFKGESRTNAEQVEKYAAIYDLYVFTDATQIVGCVYTKHTGTILHFGLLVLAEEYQGTGAGASIINAIIELAKSYSCSIVELDYLSVAPWLKKYYEKFGFIETGKREEWLGMYMIQMHKLM